MMSNSVHEIHAASHDAYLDQTATLAVSALRTLRLALPLSAALMLSACASSGLELAALATADPASSEAASSTDSSAGPAPGSIITGSLAPIDEPAARVSRAQTASRSGSEADQSRHAAAISKARGLRGNGDLNGAFSVLEAAAKTDPKDVTLLRERGLLALELGQVDEAKGLLRKADKAGPADWRIKSALGSAYAASGDQPAAQRQFAAALELAPDHPSILNNLALSYALDGRHAQAEKLLRSAAQSKATAAKAKQNLALLLGLNGNLDEARKVSEAALPKDMATSNISYLERLKSQGARVSRAERRPAETDGTTTRVGSLKAEN